MKHSWWKENSENGGNFSHLDPKQTHMPTLNATHILLNIVQTIIRGVYTYQRYMNIYYVKVRVLLTYMYIYNRTMWNMKCVCSCEPSSPDCCGRDYESVAVRRKEKKINTRQTRKWVSIRSFCCCWLLVVVAVNIAQSIIIYLNWLLFIINNVNCTLHIIIYVYMTVILWAKERQEFSGFVIFCTNLIQIHTTNMADLWITNERDHILWSWLVFFFVQTHTVHG